jgi:hypothetical protein
MFEEGDLIQYTKHSGTAQGWWGRIGIYIVDGYTDRISLRMFTQTDGHFITNERYSSAEDKSRFKKL